MTPTRGSQWPRAKPRIPCSCLTGFATQPVYHTRPLQDDDHEGGEPEKMPWKERAIAAWPPPDVTSGDKVEGRLTRTEANVNATDKNRLFDYILDVNGVESRVWGSKLLNLQVTEKDIGKNVRIQFDGYGKAQKGKNAPKQFKVQVEE
jgi:hypothetical protein